MAFSLPIFFLISFAYIAAFALTTGFFAPIQQLILPGMGDNVSLLFLPHGVRILAMVYFGWRGIIYLLPGVMGMWALSVYGGEQLDLHIGGTIVSLMSCYLGVLITCRIIYKGQGEGHTSWQRIMVAGIIASAANSVGLSALQHEAPGAGVFLGYLVGDTLGLLLLLIILMFGFRIADGR